MNEKEQLKLYRGDPEAIAHRLAESVIGRQGPEANRARPRPSLALLDRQASSGPAGFKVCVGPKGRDGLDSTIPGPRRGVPGPPSVSPHPFQRGHSTLSQRCECVRPARGSMPAL